MALRSPLALRRVHLAVVGGADAVAVSEKGFPGPLLLLGLLLGACRRIAIAHQQAEILL